MIHILLIHWTNDKRSALMAPTEERDQSEIGQERERIVPLQFSPRRAAVVPAQEQHHHAQRKH
jgi:hypothetical protein